MFPVADDHVLDHLVHRAGVNADAPDADSPGLACALGVELEDVAALDLKDLFDVLQVGR